MSQGNARWGMGATGAPGPTGPPGPAGPPGAGASGAALFELAPVDSPIFVGRFTPGSGVMQQMSPATAVGMLPVFSLVAKGLVPAPVTAAGLFLRDDATWAAAGAAGRPSGVTLAEQDVAGPQTVQGRTTLGTGTREDLSAGQVASLIGGRFGSGIQLLHAPTAIRGGMLRDDGQWVLPSFVPSGLAPGQLLPLSPLTVVGRITAGSGTREELRGGDVASLIGKFGGSGLGLVPTPTGGVQARFLGDNGQWSIPLASGITNAQLAIRPPSVILGRSGSTGIVEELVGSGVATLLPLFNNIDKGLVPGSAGGTTAFLRADGTWSIPATAGGVSGVAFNQLADISAPRFLGRLAGSGSIQELLPVTAASMLPRFLGSGVGLVPVATGGQLGAFLRDDGTWATPAGGSATGVANNQLLPMPPFTFKARTTLGSGIPEDISIGAVASMLPKYFGSGVGLVPVATGSDASSRVLRGDGTWQLPTPTGVTNSQFALAPPLTIKGNPSSTATGAVQDLSPLQVASLLGLVAIPSTTPQGLFLSDDGTFKGVPSNVATGLTFAQQANKPPFTLNGRFSTGTGVAESIGVISVASMLPLFSGSGTSKGLVAGPSATTGAFLRDDGAWSTPAGGAATGITNAMQMPMPPFTISGRNTIGSGIPEDLTTRQVASMIGAFYRPSGGSPGLVTTPTGGASGLFMKDNGTWEDLRRNEIQNGNIGSGATVGSATIDFNAGMFHTGDLYGNTHFTLVPPSGIHKHLQLRLYNGASGRQPTFYNTMVRWMGGSGGVPSLSGASGSVSIFNFFHDGQYLWGNGAGWGTKF